MVEIRSPLFGIPLTTAMRPREILPFVEDGHSHHHIPEEHQLKSPNQNESMDYVLGQPSSERTMSTRQWLTSSFGHGESMQG